MARRMVGISRETGGDRETSEQRTAQIRKGKRERPRLPRGLLIGKIKLQTKSSPRREEGVC